MKDAQIIASVFNTFQEGSALIAGGYIRDLVLGRKPKDIDILVHWQDANDDREIEILANRLGYSILNCAEGYGQSETDNLRCVYKLTKIGELPIDVIFLNCTPMERIKNFPCNASMVWTDGTSVRHLPSFEQFRNTGVLEFYETCTEEYAARMHTYFPKPRSL